MRKCCTDETLLRDIWMSSLWYGGKEDYQQKTKISKWYTEYVPTLRKKKKATCALNENTNETWSKSSNITMSLLRTGQTGKSSSTKGCMTRNYSCGVYSLHHKASSGRWTLPLLFELFLEAKYFPCLHFSK